MKAKNTKRQVRRLLGEIIFKKTSRLKMTPCSSAIDNSWESSYEVRVRICLKGGREGRPDGWRTEKGLHFCLIIIPAFSLALSTGSCNLWSPPSFDTWSQRHQHQLGGVSFFEACRSSFLGLFFQAFNF